MSDDQPEVVFEIPEGDGVLALRQALEPRRQAAATQQNCIHSHAKVQDINGYSVCALPSQKLSLIDRSCATAYTRLLSGPVDKETPSIGSIPTCKALCRRLLLCTWIGSVMVCAAGVTILVLLIVGVVLWQRTRRKPHGDGLLERGFAFDALEHTTSSEPKLDGWQDAEILKTRIPLEKIEFSTLIQCGGHGEIYKGIYNDHEVAIKELLPEKRKDLGEINAFIAEVKLMVRMQHPNIITTIGVAWDALAELCVVVEFMNRGDLRMLLTQYHRMGHPTGFDPDKLRIAVDIAHGLEYLHSLSPAVLHRDLKSRNVLLNDRLDAKLTDFGISREKRDGDATMTAGIGTMLWMAPEVMMGEKYNEKADVFSFGVLLSEIDTHKSNYHVSSSSGCNGRKNSSNPSTEDADNITSLFQLATTGQNRVQFSVHAARDVVQLGLQVSGG